MKQAQIDIVKRELQEKGFITRNWCLKNYISRLGAIIHLLKKEMDIKGKYHKYEYGKDYVYYLPSHEAMFEDRVADDFLARCRTCQRFQCAEHKGQMAML